MRKHGDLSGLENGDQHAIDVRQGTVMDDGHWSEVQDG